MAAKKRRSAAKRTTAPQPTSLVGAAPRAEPKGPHRRQLPDNKSPNDPVLFADLIALGYVDPIDVQGDGDESDDRG